MTKPLYHGGRGGMKKGMFVLPPSVTGSKLGQSTFGNHLTDSTKVYVTNDLVAAYVYAAFIPDGDVYEVEPVGELEEDPDCNTPGMSYACVRARITKRNRLSENQRQGIRQKMMQIDEAE